MSHRPLLAKDRLAAILHPPTESFDHDVLWRVGAEALPSKTGEVFAGEALPPPALHRERPGAASGPGDARAEPDAPGAEQQLLTGDAGCGKVRHFRLKGIGGAESPELIGEALVDAASARDHKVEQVRNERSRCRREAARKAREAATLPRSNRFACQRLAARRCLLKERSGCTHAVEESRAHRFPRAGFTRDACHRCSERALLGLATAIDYTEWPDAPSEDRRRRLFKALRGGRSRAALLIHGGDERHFSHYVGQAVGMEVKDRYLASAGTGERLRSVVQPEGLGH